MLSSPAKVGPAERLMCDDGEGDSAPPLSLPGVWELPLLRNTGSPVTILGSRRPLRRLSCAAAVSENPRVLLGGTWFCERERVRLFSTLMLSLPGV